MAHYKIAIIGGGFSGTMAAVQLCKMLPAASIALIERNDAPGPGLAYGTTDPDHLLNVRAAQMGAFPNQPDHFWNWLQCNPAQGVYREKDFVPRRIYGNYLKDILRETCAAHAGLRLVKQRVLDVRRLDNGFELVAEDGENITADKIILALGNFPPDRLGQSGELNPYAPEIWRQIADDGDVLIVGTGLTSLDLVITLAKTKKTGVVHLLSRHGLLPREHAETKPYQLNLDMDAMPKTALGIYCRIKQEIERAAGQGLTWRSVIDALRSHNQRLWQGMNGAEKKKFLRHLRAYWDVHRHRCAPQVMDAYRTFERAGRLQLHAGPLISRNATDKGWRIEWRPRGKTVAEYFAVRHIVYCTGPQSDFRKLGDPLVQNLLKSKLISPDPLSLGIATTEQYEVLGGDGAVTEGLYALGSVLKGRLYESVAVPELRGQAYDVAREVSKKVT